VRIPTRRIYLPAALFTALLLACSGIPAAQPAADTVQAIVDRALIRELMDQYGLVHDLGTPEEYADLFADDGELATGGPATIKGRQALLAQARRDHERFDVEQGADGKPTSIMRHLIGNAQITLTGPNTANGVCYVTTVVKKGAVGPAILSISRYLDSYTKKDGRWRIQRREIKLEFGNSELARELGFTNR
jgi:SnoaL-like domain